MSGLSAFLAARFFIPLLNTLWQGAAIAALVWLAMRFLPRLNAATRYAIWWVVLAAVVLLPFVPRRQPSQHPPGIVRSSTGGATNPLLPEIEMPAIVRIRPATTPRWPLAIAALWITVFLYRFTRIAQSFIYLRRVKAEAFASSDPIPHTGRHARLLLSREIPSPIAVGFWKPAVILPLSLPSDLERDDLDHVVLHEAAHLARRDDWANLAARVWEAIFALHPISLWILRQIEREREMACDEWVVARTGQARNYAVSLARMYELRWAKSGEILASEVFAVNRALPRELSYSSPGAVTSPAVCLRSGLPSAPSCFWLWSPPAGAPLAGSRSRRKRHGPPLMPPLSSPAIRTPFGLASAGAATCSRP